MRMKKMARYMKRHWKALLCEAGLGVLLAFVILLLYNAHDLPKHCSLCEGIRCHAPCMVNLTTGEVVEMELYEPHPKLVAEIAGVHPRGDMAFMYGAGLKMIRDRGSWKIVTQFPHNWGRVDRSKFCFSCRWRLMGFYSSKYVIADLYDRQHPSLYSIWNGAQYDMRCYRVTVSKEDGFVITLKGLLEDYR